MNTFPTLDDVERIAGLDEPVVRNLQITQCYHELALAVGRRTAGQANWCHFATWASKQAGQTIRREDLARALEQLLRPAPAPGLEVAGPVPPPAAAVTAVAEVAAEVQEIGARGEAHEIRETVWEVLNPLSALERAGEAVGRGNRKVFAEIGREFARFAAEFLEDPAFDEARIEAFCDGLRPGEPPDGQRYLRQAFRRIYQGFFEDDPKRRAELMLLANLEIGLHEQTRLQPEIAAGMEAALVDPGEFRARLLQAVFPYRGWPERFRLWLKRLLGRRSPLDEAIDRLMVEAKRRLRLVLTEHMMAIGLPGGARLPLGQDLPGPFPASLRAIADPELVELLGRIDPTPDSPRDSGAADWADLPDRLHFIADFFRTYQEKGDLWRPPFLAEQVAVIRDGRRPEGVL
jgi:hypothetical protein